MKKGIKSIILAILGLFAASALAVVIAPTFFEDKVIQAVKTEINQQIEGEVDFADIDVTWWSSFPDVSVQLDQLRVTGLKSDSSQQDLIVADQLSFGLDFMSVWTQGDSLDIKSFSLTDPVVFIYIDENGRANYNLAKEKNTNETSESTAIKFDLSDYSIKNATIRYLDAGSALDISLNETDHSGKLTYEDDKIVWDALLKSPEFTLTQQNIPYLQNTAVDFNGGLHFDLSEKVYRFLQNDLILNALQLYLEGDIADTGDDLDFDLHIKSRKNTFKSFLSVLPNLYTNDFNKIKTRGNLELQGSMKGVYSQAKKQYPKYYFDLKVDDGWFQFPGKDQAISDIFLTGQINNSNTSFEPATIQVPLFNFILNGEKISGDINIENRNNNQFFDGAAKGKINLLDLQSAYPFPSVEALSGLLDIDAEFSGNTNAIQSKALNELNYSGFINGEDVQIVLEEQPPIAVNKFESTLENDRLVINEIYGTIGRSDFTGTGAIAPISAFMTEQKTPVSLAMDVHGQKLDVDELLGPKSNDTDASEKITASSSLLRTMEFDAVMRYDEVIYEDYELKAIQSKAQGNLNELHLQEFTGEVNQDAIDAQGTLRNIYGYTYKNEILRGELDIRSDKFNIDSWMTSEEGNGEAANQKTEYAIIPERINLNLNVHTDRLNYQKIDVNQAKGEVVIRDQRVIFKGVTGKSMGGDFGIDGYYAYDGNNEPLFKLDYDLKKFSFEKTFRQVEMAQKLLPIIQFIQGTFNNALSIEGSLKEGYMPNLATLDGKGLMETLHGNIVKNTTLEKIANLVDLDELKSLTIDRSHNRFSIKNGELIVDPFEKSIDDIHANISGSHQLEGDMNYKMTLTIPTEKFKVNGIPLNIKDQFASVQKQLQKIGIKLEDTESIRVDVLIQGSMTDPNVRVKLVDFSELSVEEVVEDIAKDLIEQAKDSATNTATTTIIETIQGDNQDSTITTIEDAVTVRVQEEIDTLIQEEINPVKDTLISQAEDAIQGQLDTLLTDQLDDEVKDAAEDILDIFNPFKKKKKN